MAVTRVAILGAGMTGSICAWALRRAGVHVTMFEMGRGSGGRMATRKTRDHPALSFNHGAPAFDVKDPEFQSVVDTLVDLGVVKRWQCTSGTVNVGAKAWGTKETSPLYVGVPGMSSVCERLNEGAERRFNVMLTSFQWRDRCWVLGDRAGTEVGAFDWLVVTSHTVGHPRWTQLFGTPPPLQQAVENLSSPQASALVSTFAEVRTTPRMVAMLAFEVGPAWASLPFDMAEVEGSSVLTKWVRQATSPDSPYVLFVLHSTAEFATQHLHVTGTASTSTRFGAIGDPSKESEVGQLLSEAFYASVKPWLAECPTPVWGPVVHRWSNCFPLPDAQSRPISSAEVLALDVHLCCCGDHMGPNAGSVEAAALSGLRAANALISALSDVREGLSAGEAVTAV